MILPEVIEVEDGKHWEGLDVKTQNCRVAKRKDKPGEYFVEIAESSYLKDGSVWFILDDDITADKEKT